MIRYTSKDIINRAEQLADLQNSDFISDSEKQYLLNEAWGIFYQKITNAKDKAFIKKVSVYNGFTLPLDFMQLSSIYETRSKNGLCKMTDGQNSGYDIVNNRIVLSKDYESVGVTMEYFPHPQTLFYNSGKKEAKSFIVEPLVIIDDDLFIAEIGGDYYLYSFSNDTQISQVSGSGFKFKNGRIVLQNENQIAFKSYNGDDFEIRTNIPFVVRGNTVTYDMIQTDEDLSDYAICFTDNSGEVLYYLNRENSKIYTKNFEETDISVLEDYLLYLRDDGLYIGIPGAGFIYRVLGNVVERFALGLNSFCTFVDDFSVIESFNSKFYKSSYGFNTILDYPSNIYFTVLAYSLAVSFKMKQNGDPTLLNSKLDEAVNQFWDSLSRDDNNQYTIRNVYKSRGRIW